MFVQPTRQSRRLFKSQRGFTLPELMTALVVMAIGTMMAIPAYHGWASRTELNSALSEISSGLGYARVAAMNRNRTISVTFTMSGSRVQVVNGANSKTSLLGSRVTAFTVATGPSVSFSSLGLRSGGGGGDQLVTITNDKGVVYSIVVSPGGKVTACAMSTCP